MARASRYARIAILTLFAGLAPLHVAVVGGQAEDERTAAEQQGAELYQIYCSNCHGKRGLGDGPTAEVLTVVPANLTTLARRNGGEFPAERVYKTIDGRADVRAHGQRQMPIWGLAFQEYDRDTNQEAEVAFRIRRLVDYLKSIQDR